jgi:hypothetical protein
MKIRIFFFLSLLTAGKLFSQQPLVDSLTIQRIKDTLASVLPEKTVKDTSWKTTGFAGINFAQTSLSNWQGGGEDNFSVLGLFQYEANYLKDGNEWSNKIDLQFGIIRAGAAKFWRKNSDQVFFTSQFKLKAFNSPRWFYSLMTDFRSQFAPGYNFQGDSTREYISNWAAPAYVQLALGFGYKLQDYFSVTLSPLAGKMTIVNDPGFANRGDFGVEKAITDSAGNILTPGKMIRYEFGGRLTVKLQKDIAKNFHIDSYADFFTNYLDHPENIDIVWNTLVTLKINKWLSATASVKLIYDNDINILYDWNKDGLYDNPKDINGPRAQWMSTFGVGLGYKF